MRCSITAARDKFFMNNFFKEVYALVPVRDIETKVTGHLFSVN